MRTLFLEYFHSKEQICWRNCADDSDLFIFSWINEAWDTVYFTQVPTVRRSLVDGIKVIDFGSNRVDRVFGPKTSEPVATAGDW